MNHQEAVGALASLSQESRLAVFRLLVKRGPEGYPAGEIAARLDLPGPTLSFHLKSLSQAGLVVARRDGRFLHYSASMPRVNALVGYLTEHCCSLGSTCDADCAPAATARTRGLRVERLAAGSRKAQR